MKQIHVAFVTFLLAVVFVCLRIWFQQQQRIQQSSFKNVVKEEDTQLILERDLKMFSTEEQEKLSLILQRKADASVEVVVAAHSEDLTWAKMYNNIVTIYWKGHDHHDNNINNPLRTTTTTTTATTLYQTFKNVIPIANVGRETNTYLYHIVHNYNKLADVTVFTQGHAPTQGYLGHRDGGGHMYCQTSLHDYVLARRGLFVFNELMSLENSFHVVRRGYGVNACKRDHRPFQQQQRRRQQQQQQHYINETICFSPKEGAVGLSPSSHHPITMQITSDSCLIEETSVCDSMSFWQQYIKLPQPEHNIVWYAQGAVFSVTKENIRKRSLLEYQQLLLLSSAGKDTSIGFFMEYFWYYLLTSPTVAPCVCSNDDIASFLNLIKQRPLQERLPFPLLLAHLRQQQQEQQQH